MIARKFLAPHGLYNNTMCATNQCEGWAC